jgi:hypothetical protein
LKFNSKLSIILLSLLVQSISSAQVKFYSKIVTDTLTINFENNYSISHVTIVPNSEIICLRNKILGKDDYNFSYKTNTFKLSDSLAYSIFDTLFVTYETLDLGLKKDYKNRSLVIRYDTKAGDTLRVSKAEQQAFTSESIFGSNIEKSGTLVRGFTVGTNQDFSLNSGLRLQLSGKLSDDIEVVAALTDENTPIQPEGNTERLDELDKVFIQIKHPLASGTFGDYQLQKKQGEFGFIDRKLQGLLGEFNVNNTSGYVAIASSRGRYTTNKFNGIDGVQGPYILSGINGERDIIVLAGTERVYIDGIEMKRGEANDYTIDYSNAQVTFTPKRLITSYSRISVDFEYTDRKYSRNFFGTGLQSKLLSNKLGVQFQYMREGDNQDAPIDISLSQQDKQILAAAGDNRNKAVKPGVSLALPDSLGNIRGLYVKVDTSINNAPFSYYRYDPGNPDAIYNVSFSFVGDRLGDYTRESLGNFLFVGKGRGTYLPVVYLPLPELKQVANLVVDLNPARDVSVSLEYAGSLYDQNRFSNLDDGNNYGYARNIFLKVNPQKINLGSLSLGKVGLSYKDRFIQNKFTSLDRIDEVEFNRYYNVSDTEQNVNQELREIDLNLIPINLLNINSMAGFLNLGSNFNSTRFNNTVQFSDNKNFQVNYNFDYVKTKNLSLRSSWLRQTGSAFYQLWKLKPGVDFLAENRRDKSDQKDSLLSTSLKYYEIDPFLNLVDLGGISLSAKYSMREDYLPLNGIMFDESKSLTQFYELSYNGIKQVSTTINFTYRIKKYKEIFKQQGLLNNETILIRSQTRLNLWDPIKGDLYYEVSTQKSAKLQKVFVRVQQGTGNYKYLGDLNNNGVADENEFEPTLFEGDYILVTVPTDQLYPVIDLKTNTKWRIEFAKMFDKNSLAEKILSPLSSETLWRLEENSTEQHYSKIYLLHLSSFQNDKTIFGSNYVQQDLFLFENNPDFSMRFRYSQMKNLNQYSEGVERGFNRERSLRINFKMVEEISNQTDLVNETDNVYAPSSSNRKRLITNNNITTDFSYRPERNIEVGFRIKSGRSEDDYPANPTVIDLNSQAVRLNLSFAAQGRLNIEIERDELNANTLQNFLPFELTEGNQIGKNYFLRVNFDYKISSNLQSTLSYDGRAQGKSPIVHTARAEVRAYF